MKLSVCVPHYNEKFDTCRFLFDTLAVQRGIDFSEIEVLIGNDGSEKHLRINQLEGYPYRVTVYNLSHKGVSATRNALLDKAKGEYVMFCDCDDGFCQTYGLHLLFAKMKEKPDVIISSFVEENIQDGKFLLIRHDNDVQFIHGKAFRKEFLVKKDIRFKDELLIHEDGYFNNIVCNEAETYANIENPFYVWRWNDESICRKEDGELFLMRTYPNLMATRDAVCEELKNRGFKDEYLDSVAKSLVDAYYELQKPIYYDPMHKEERKLAEQSIQKFYQKYKKDFAKCDIKLIAEIMSISRTTAYKRGMQVEHSTFPSFIKYLEGGK